VQTVIAPGHAPPNRLAGQVTQLDARCSTVYPAERRARQTDPGLGRGRRASRSVGQSGHSGLNRGLACERCPELRVPPAGAAPIAGCAVANLFRTGALPRARTEPNQARHRNPMTRRCGDTLQWRRRTGGRARRCLQRRSRPRCRKTSKPGALETHCANGTEGGPNPYGPTASGDLQRSDEPHERSRVTW